MYDLWVNDINNYLKILYFKETFNIICRTKRSSKLINKQSSKLIKQMYKILLFQNY